MYRLGFFIEIEMPGIDSVDAMHRAEMAFKLYEGTSANAVVSKERGGIQRGILKRVTWLTQKLKEE